MSFVNVFGEAVDIKALIAKGAGASRIGRQCWQAQAYTAAGLRRGSWDRAGRQDMPGLPFQKNAVQHGVRKAGSSGELRRATWTHGPGTDIHAGSPACSKFSAKEAA